MRGTFSMPVCAVRLWNNKDGKEFIFRYCFVLGWYLHVHKRKAACLWTSLALLPNKITNVITRRDARTRENILRYNSMIVVQWLSVLYSNWSTCVLMVLFWYYVYTYCQSCQFAMWSQSFNRWSHGLAGPLIEFPWPKCYGWVLESIKTLELALMWLVPTALLLELLCNCMWLEWFQN